MIEMSIEIQNLDTLRANFQKAPAMVLKYLARATQASSLEIHKRADDGGDSKLFQFKTPRAKRTGMLAQSFTGMSSIDGLTAWVGPRVKYAWAVYTGHRPDPRNNRTIFFGANKYMDRIAKDATPDVQKHFQKAVDNVVSNLAKT